MRAGLTSLRIRHLGTPGAVWGAFAPQFHRALQRRVVAPAVISSP
jgi:hypothetical protein